MELQLLKIYAEGRRVSINMHPDESKMIDDWQVDEVDEFGFGKYLSEYTRTTGDTRHCKLRPRNHK